MSSVVPLQILATIPRPHEEVVARSTADFPPGLLVDIFLSYTPDETTGSYECKQNQIEELKEEVRKEIKAAATAKIRSPEPAKLIDSIQLLGLAYHFETEIGDTIKPVKQLIKRVFQTYFVEAKWLKERYAPTFDEYISNAEESTCYTVLTAASFLGMGDEVTEEVFKWLLSRGEMLRASECICGLMDDLVTHEFEKTRDHIPTSIECYMKQHDVTEKEACDELNKLIENAWKDINQGFLVPRQVPMSVAGNVLNFARVMDVLYKDGDAYTHVGKLMKDLIASTLIDPVPM